MNEENFEMRFTGSGYEILSPLGEVVASVMDYVWAALLLKLLQERVVDVE